MRASQYYLATLKEAPQEAELASHRLMLRAGLIRKLASGLYTWMPLALRRHARARVHDEGCVLVRRRLRRAEEELPGDVRRVHAHLHAPRARIPRGRRRPGRDRRHRLARVPGDRGFRRGCDRLLPAIR